MHELGVLLKAVKTVHSIAEKNKIDHVKFMTLEVGEESGYLPIFLNKLFPIAIEHFPTMQNSELKIQMAPGRGLTIKDIGY